MTLYIIVDTIPWDHINITIPKNGSTALTFVAEKGHIDIARMLIDKGANLDIQEKKVQLYIIVLSIERITIPTTNLRIRQ